MITQRENINVLRLLKDLATRCIYLNLAALVLFLGISLFTEITSELAVICGTIAILISVFPFVYALQKRKTALLFSGISVVNIAPTWFLYLESILPGYDAFSYIQPGYRVMAFFWISVFQLLVNLTYVLLWRRG